MANARQLYQLQELDLAIDAADRELKDKTAQLGESRALIDARSKLAAAQQQLDELKKKQRATEWDIDDLGAKIRAGDDQLYSGRIRNPKELASLQQEMAAFKAKRDKLETALLEVMDRVEATEKEIVATGAKLKETETEWQGQQQTLAAEIESVKARNAGLQQQRQTLAGEIDAKSLELYRYLKKAKGQAVARVEQGICRGCRISLPSSDLQQARAGHLAPCSSCGRILYLP